MDTEKLRQIISHWALNLAFRTRIYFYGSRLECTHKPDSDLDLAIEFLDPWIDPGIEWHFVEPQWQHELSNLIGINVHLELYDDKNEHVKKYVEDKSIIVFEAPKPEIDSEDLPRSLDIELNNE